MQRSVVGLSLALLAGTSFAQIPLPSQGNGGFIFAAWDANESYTYYLGFDFMDFDPEVPNQVFALPDVEGVFSDLDEVRWSLISSDGDGDILFGGAAFYTTGSVTNLTSGAGVLAATGAQNVFINSLNVVDNCPGGANAPCLADVNTQAYAGQDAYGDDLGFSGGLVVSAGFGEEAAFNLVEQVPFNPDGQATVTTFDLTVFFDGVSVIYGASDAPVVPLPAAVWLMLGGMATLATRRRRRGEMTPASARGAA